MNGVEIKVFEGRLYGSRPLRDGERACEGCAAVDGLKHDWDLCEALRPCGRANMPDGACIVWKQYEFGVDYGTAEVLPDALTLVKAYGEVRAVDVVARRGAPTLVLQVPGKRRPGLTLAAVAELANKAEALMLRYLLQRTGACAGTSAALVLAHRTFVVHSDVAEWDWSACCARCKRDLEAAGEVVVAEVSFEDAAPCVWECEFCGAGKGEALRWLLTDEGMEEMFHA